MGPEKEIAIWWLNRNGFFTVSSIKVSGNREIEIIAFKPSSGEVLHVEISCSVGSGILSLQKSVEASAREFVDKKFNDPAVEKVVNRKIKDFLGHHHGYERVVVLGIAARQRRDELAAAFQNQSVKMLRFEELLLDVMNNLDGQNYKSDVIRTLQLVKFLLLSSPSHSASLVAYSGEQEALNSVGKEVFLKSLLDNPEFVKYLQKESNEELLASIVKKSSLKRTKQLMRLISQGLTSRSRKKIHRELSKIEPVVEKRPAKKKEKSLLSFFQTKK